MDINFIIITFVGQFLQTPFNSGFYNCYFSSSTVRTKNGTMVGE